MLTWRLAFPTALLQVFILVSDICGFTAFCAARTPADVVNLLSDIYTEFDKLCDKFGVYKVCTIGDAYVIIAGLPHIEQQLESQRIKNCEPNPAHKLDYGRRLMEMALAMVNETRRKGAELGFDFNMRIGIHFGKVVMGVIGTTKLRYDIWGTDVMLASLCESEGEPGAIHVSSSAYNKGNLKAHFKFGKHKTISIPGAKGQSTYLHPPPSTKPAALPAAETKPAAAEILPGSPECSPESPHSPHSPQSFAIDDVGARLLGSADPGEPTVSSTTSATLSALPVANAALAIQGYSECKDLPPSAAPTTLGSSAPLANDVNGIAVSASPSGQSATPRKQRKPEPPPEPPPSPPPNEPPYPDWQFNTTPRGTIYPDWSRV